MAAQRRGRQRGGSASHGLDKRVTERRQEEGRGSARACAAAEVTSR